MSREVERTLDHLVQAVIEEPEIAEAFRELQFSPAEKGEELKGILLRSIEDFRRFFLRRALPPVEKTYSPKEVAARYGLTPHWAHHCKELKKFSVKTGKYRRYRESDLLKFEAERSEKQETGPRQGYSLPALIRRQSVSHVTTPNKMRLVSRGNAND